MIYFDIMKGNSLFRFIHFSLTHCCNKPPWCKCYIIEIKSEVNKTCHSFSNMQQLSFIIKLCSCFKDVVWFLKALMMQELHQTDLDSVNFIKVTQTSIFKTISSFEKGCSFFLLACSHSHSILIRFPLIVKQTVGSTSVVSGCKTAH